MTKDNGYLTVQEAAEYLGVSIQTLRRWDTSGRLKPVRHPVNQYRFYRRSELEPFRLAYRSAEQRGSMLVDLFHQPASIEGNELLREPQREAHRAAMQHFERSNAHAIIQLPVGCGKTGVVATLPFGIATGRVLALAPNVTIRQNLYDAVDIANPRCFWRRAKVMRSLERGPFSAILDGRDANIHDCENSHFVVANIQQLASSADRWLPQFPPNFFDMILVDEGHHNVAPSWRRVFERFPNARVVSLTATPFRSDEQRVEGEVIYRYGFSRAMLKGYIKQMHSANVAPAEIFFTYRGDEHRHTLDEVMALREEQWFRRGVALAPECNRHIVEASVAKLNALRTRTGIKHQLIAVGCSVDHARQIRSLYQERGLRAKEIFSEMEPDEQAQVLNELRQGRLDAIVQVKMLGEGFDHNLLSVAAIFRPFRSLSPYIQFVGRAMRVVHEEQPGHPDNQGFVVSHVGLNNETHWDDFMEFDQDDQAIFRGWVREEGDSQETDEAGGGSPRRFDVGMQVSREVVGHIVGDSFLDIENDGVIDEMLQQRVGGVTLAQLGITREKLREELRANQPARKEVPEAVPVDPQRRRKALKKRLDERTKAAAARVLKDLNLKPIGYDIGRAMRKPAVENREIVITELNSRLNALMGAKNSMRRELNNEQLEFGYSRIDSVADELRESIQSAMGEGA